MSKDGARDTPSAGTAENWGRQDRIRAGSVSGPWRSAPRDGHGESGPAAPPPRGGTGHGVAAALEKARARPTGATGRIDSGPPPRKPVPHAPAADPARSDIIETIDRQRRSVRVAIVAGGLIALAIVAAAFLLRPGAAPEMAAPVTPAPSETVAAVPTPSETVAAAPAPSAATETVAAVPDGSEAAPAPVEPAVADAGSGAIRLRVGPNLAPERREQIAAALEAQGYGPVRVEVLPFPIAASRVGFYRAEDEASAAALAEFISGVLGDGGIKVSTRDYGKLLSDTEPGRLDVWIEG